MQRRAQRDQRDQRAKRAHRLNRVLVCAAAAPVMLVAAGCSSSSGSDSDGKTDSSAKATASVSASPTVQAAAYQQLPEPCAVLSGETLGELVPKGTKSGKEGKSNDTETRANCSWNSLVNNGVKGSQFRWLNVSLLRFDSDVTTGEGEKLAQEYYDKQVRDAQSVSGAQNTKSTPVAGTGDEATAVRYDLKKKEGSFKQQTVVARVENVVITLDYNGAGLAGEKAPSADTLAKLAEKAAKEAVAAVTAANAKRGGAGTTSPAPSGPASASPSKSASASPSKSASKKS